MYLLMRQRKEDNLNIQCPFSWGSYFDSVSFLEIFKGFLRGDWKGLQAWLEGGERNPWRQPIVSYWSNILNFLFICNACCFCLFDKELGAVFFSTFWSDLSPFLHSAVLSSPWKSSGKAKISNCPSSILFASFSSICMSYREKRCYFNLQKCLSVVMTSIFYSCLNLSNQGNFISHHKPVF